MSMDRVGHTEVIPNMKRRVKVEESGVVHIRQIKTTLSIGASAGVDREWYKASGGCIDSTDCNRGVPTVQQRGEVLGR